MYTLIKKTYLIIYILITLDNSENIEFKGLKIQKRNIIDWLLDI